MRKIGMMLVALFLTVAVVGCGESTPARPTGTVTATTTVTGTVTTVKTSTDTSTAK